LYIDFESARMKASERTQVGQLLYQLEFNSVSLAATEIVSRQA